MHQVSRNKRIKQAAQRPKTVVVTKPLKQDFIQAIQSYVKPTLLYMNTTSMPKDPVGARCHVGLINNRFIYVYQPRHRIVLMSRMLDKLIDGTEFMNQIYRTEQWLQKQVKSEMEQICSPDNSNPNFQEEKSV